jgi:hypothetical protein
MNAISWAGVMGVGMLRVLLVDPAGPSSVALNQRGSISSSSWITLPGANIVSDSGIFVLPLGDARARAPGLDSLRQAGASLRVYEWRGRARFPVTATTAP